MTLLASSEYRPTDVDSAPDQIPGSADADASATAPAPPTPSIHYASAVYPDTITVNGSVYTDGGRGDLKYYCADKLLDLDLLRISA